MSRRRPVSRLASIRAFVVRTGHLCPPPRSLQRFRRHGSGSASGSRSPRPGIFGKDRAEVGAAGGADIEVRGPQRKAVFLQVSLVQNLNDGRAVGVGPVQGRMHSAKAAIAGVLSDVLRRYSRVNDERRVPAMAYAVDRMGRAIRCVVHDGSAFSTLARLACLDLSVLRPSDKPPSSSGPDRQFHGDGDDAALFSCCGLGPESELFVYGPRVP